MRWRVPGYLSRAAGAEDTIVVTTGRRSDWRTAESLVARFSFEELEAVRQAAGFDDARSTT